MKLKYQSEEYQKGFKAAVNFFNDQLEVQINKLTTFPVLTERRIAMMTMKEVLNESLKELINE